MSKFVLFSTVRYGATMRYAGEVIDDAQENTTPLIAAGAILLDWNKAAFKAASVRCDTLAKRGERRAEEMDRVMLQAAIADIYANVVSDVPATRLIATGNGLSGGGNLTADRTLTAIADAEASIVVGAGGIKVGVLASDAEHGNRGGGAIHAAVIAGGASGFMTGADKTKLNRLPTTTFDATATTQTWPQGTTNPIVSIEQPEVTTADATPTDLITYTVVDGTSVDIFATVMGYEVGTGDTYRADVAATFESHGGVLSQVGATAITNARNTAGAAAWAPTLSEVGEVIHLKVTGAAATPIKWTGTMQIMPKVG